MMVNAGVKPEEGALAMSAVPDKQDDPEGWDCLLIART